MSPEPIAILAVGGFLAGVMLTLPGGLDRRIDRLGERLTAPVERVARLDGFCDTVAGRQAAQ